MAQDQKAIIPIPDERIINRIFVIRGKKVMMDRDLAELYGVETKQLKRAVRRNIDRFPDDFMFQLTKEEMNIWKSQIDTSSLRYQNGTSSRGSVRYLPMVFTEQGVAMLSSVLKSKRAIQVNLAIVRAFVRLRELLATNEELRQKIEEMDGQLAEIYEMLAKFLAQEKEPKNRIGYRTDDRR